jgi:hypothetical protein
MERRIFIFRVALSIASSSFWFPKLLTVCRRKVRTLLIPRTASAISLKEYALCFRIPSLFRRLSTTSLDLRRPLRSDSRASIWRGMYVTTATDSGAVKDSPAKRFRQKYHNFHGRAIVQRRHSIFTLECTSAPSS